MTRAPSILLLLLLLMFSVGCRSQSGQKGYARELQSAEMSQRQLQANMTDFARRYSGIIERAAEQILAGTDDPEIRRNTLRMRIVTVSACQSAAFNSDPYVALHDTWAFLLQSRQFLADGPGVGRFVTPLIKINHGESIAV